MHDNESWLTGLDHGRGIPTEIASANHTHHNKKIRIEVLISTLILYELRFITALLSHIFFSHSHWIC